MLTNKVKNVYSHHPLNKVKNIYAYQPWFFTCSGWADEWVFLMLSMCQNIQICVGCAFMCSKVVLTGSATSFATYWKPVTLEAHNKDMVVMKNILATSLPGNNFMFLLFGELAFGRGCGPVARQTVQWMNVLGLRCNKIIQIPAIHRNLVLPSFLTLKLEAADSLGMCVKWGTLQRTVLQWTVLQQSFYQ